MFILTKHAPLYISTLIRMNGALIDRSFDVVIVEDYYFVMIIIFVKSIFKRVPETTRNTITLKEPVFNKVKYSPIDRMSTARIVLDYSRSAYSFMLLYSTMKSPVEYKYLVPVDHHQYPPYYC